MIASFFYSLGADFDSGAMQIANKAPEKIFIQAFTKPQISSVKGILKIFISLNASAFSQIAEINLSDNYSQNSAYFIEFGAPCHFIRFVYLRGEESSAEKLEVICQTK